MNRWNRVTRVVGGGLLIAVLGLAVTAYGEARDEGAELRLREVIRRLGEGDYASRVGAQKELENITSFRDRNALVAAFSTTDDEEVRTRLLARIRAIESSLVTDPPTISVELKDAEIPEVARALSASLGEEVGWWRSSDPSAPVVAPFARYTLSAKNRSFWEVVEELGRQHPISLSDGESFNLQENPSINVRRGTHLGGLGVFPTTEVAGFGSFLFAIDPRDRVASYAPPRWALTVDDLGNIGFKNHDLADPPWWAVAKLNGHVWNVGAAPYSGKGGAKEIASATGIVNFVMKIGEHTITLTDPENEVDKPLHVAGKMLTITRFDITEKRVNVSLAYQVGRPLPGATSKQVGRHLLDAKLVQVQLLDGTGAALHSSVAVTRNFSFVRPLPADFVRPLMLRLSSFLETEEKSVPFELKHLSVVANVKQ